MKFVRYAETEIKSRGINHRVGSFRYKDMGEGLPGTPGNFFLRLVWSETDFFSPRHLHNFDQVRVQVQGEFDFATDGTMKPGTIGYFPESTPYGPQTSRQDTIQLVLQIGGPSGSGYLSEAERVAAVEKLAAGGRFSEGRYFAAGDTTSTGVDSFQATWEAAMGRRMVYPKQRFQKPVLVHPDALTWLPVPGAAGVEHKRVWDYGRNTVGLDLYRLAPGATLEVPGTACCFVEQGQGMVSCAGTQAPYALRDVAHAAEGETLRVVAADATQLIVFVHPTF